MTKRFYYSINQRLKGFYVIMIGGILLAFATLMEGGGDQKLHAISQIIIVFLIVGFVDMALRFLWALPWYIQVENGQLQFVYLLKRKNIPLTEIQSIRVKKNEIGKFEKLLTIVILEMKNGKKIEFNGAIAQGYQVLVDTIQRETGIMTLGEILPDQ